jgi:predicted Fe-Mo cluster-binding NifX family protein
MKLCITASGKEWDASVDTTFGRALFFQIIDTESMAKEVVENPAATGGQGAGVDAAQQVADKGVEAVLTGFVGPHAYNALRACNIKIFEGASLRDSVREALDKFLQGSFQEASGGSSREECRPDRSMGRGLGRGGGRCRRSTDRSPGN